MSGTALGPPEPPIRPLRVELLPPAVPPVRPAPRRGRWGLAALLFLLSIATTATLGAVLLVSTRTDATIAADPWLTPATVLLVWRDPALRSLGLQFALSALFILLCHELGHYLACRRYRLAVTPPFFLPAPIGVGTFGAFIRIRSPIRSRRELFDVGVAGPLAGFAALLPFLLVGVARSRPVALPAAVPVAEATSSLWVPGKCLAIELAARALHGPEAAGAALDLHPFALAAWFGLLATAINLLPLGQLDGGHILYAVTGSAQRRLALPLWLALAAAGLAWAGWLVWCAIALVMGLYHPPVADERTPVGAGRTAVALVALAILVLSFVPVPLREIPLR